MSRHNCRIKTEAGSELVKKIIETLTNSDDYLELESWTQVLDDLLEAGKVNQEVWFDAVNAWARAREIIDDREGS